MTHIVILGAGTGGADPVYEKCVLKRLGIEKLGR